MTDTYQRTITVTRVIDGDTIEADTDLGYHTLLRGVQYRLARINCPEMTGTTKGEGLAAKIYTDTWFTVHRNHTPFTAQSTKTDNWKRWIGEITCASGHNLSDDLLATGHAVLYVAK